MAHLVLEVDNVDGMAIREGMAVTVGVPLKIRHNIVTVPRKALLTEGIESVVFVEGEAGFLRTQVKTGAKTFDRIEVEEGLSPGDTIAVKGVLPLLLALQQRVGGSAAGHHGHRH